MAKIHVMGGSDLEIKFTNDSGTDLDDCQLDLVGNNWYKVRRTGQPARSNGPALEAVKEPQNLTVFRAAGDRVKQIEIGYRDTPRKP